MEVEEVLEIIRKEMIQQAHKHSQAALAKVAEYKNNKKVDLLTKIFRLSFTAEALENFSHALTLERFAEWMLKAYEEDCENG